MVEAHIPKLALGLPYLVATHLAWACPHSWVVPHLKATRCFVRAEDLRPSSVFEDRHIATGEELERPPAKAQMVELDGIRCPDGIRRSECFEPGGVYDIDHRNVENGKLLALHGIRYLTCVPSPAVRSDRPHLDSGIEQHLRQLMRRGHG